MTGPSPDIQGGFTPTRRRRLRPAGNYRQLASFQTATLIYDATVWFCEKFLDSRSRTVDQMVQAARSGRGILDQQLAALEEAFIEGGGYSEQLATARLAQRARGTQKDPPDRANPADPIPQCPQCAKPMALRTARTGKHSGRQFWGCTGYPECRGTAEV